MRVGSLCSGYGGLEMGAQAVIGGTVAWHVENDPNASRILAHHWPDVPNHHDLTTVDWATVEPVDVIAAGYPCQPFSHAGKRKGTKDERHLWPFVIGAVRHLRPRLVLLENVAGHLSLGFDVVLGDLAEAGFDAEWVVLRAADVGAPHGRARVFIAAYPEGIGHERPGTARRGWDGPADGGVAVADAGREHGRQRLTVPKCSGQGRPSDEPERPAPTDWGIYEPAIRRWEALTRRAPAPVQPSARGGRPQLSPAFVEWMQGLPAGHVTDPAIWDGLKPATARNAQLTALGNGVVPQQAAAAYAQLLDALASAA